MYINEAIRRVQNYCPSEYSLSEMYTWCDEVSSMLAIEDREVFSKVTLVPNRDGEILLPQNLDFENIKTVVHNGRLLKKEDLRNPSVLARIKSPIDVVFLVPYKPIRQIRYRGEIKIDKAASIINVKADGFRFGDSIAVEAGDIKTELSVLGVTFCGDGSTDLLVSGSGFDTLSNNEDAVVTRIVTDKTVCDAPYDGMYVDYMIAKICMYQRDFNTYNQFMSTFNSRLDAYKRWITNNIPQAGGRLHSFW